MGVYGVALVPLGRMMREAERARLLARELETEVEEPASTQAIFSDDYCSAGRIDNQVEVMKDLVRWGPSFGYFPEPEKLGWSATPRWRIMRDTSSAGRNLPSK